MSKLKQKLAQHLYESGASEEFRHALASPTDVPVLTAELNLAEAIIDALPDMVQPLEWDTRYGPSAGHFADSPMGGVYRAFQPNGGDRAMWILYSSYPHSGVILDQNGDSIGAAFYTLEGAKDDAKDRDTRRALAPLGVTV